MHLAAKLSNCLDKNEIDAEAPFLQSVGEVDRDPLGTAQFQI